jgi:hypothetical protein
MAGREHVRRRVELPDSEVGQERMLAAATSFSQRRTSRRSSIPAGSSSIASASASRDGPPPSIATTGNPRSRASAATRSA